MWLKHAYPIFDIGDWIKNISIEIDSWSKKNHNVQFIKCS